MTKRKDPAIPTIPETPVKATDAEVRRRINSVYKLIVIGTGRAQILQLAADNWELSERQGDEYIARAKQLLIEQVDRDKESNLTMALARMGDIYQQCMAAKNFKGAIASQVEINKLLGLYAPTQQKIDIHHTWQDDAIQQIKTGTLTYEAALETFDHDDTLVRSLFAKAEIPVSIGEDQS